MNKRKNRDTMYWDPLGEEINESTYALQHRELLQKAEWYREHPDIIKRNRNLFVLFIVCVAIISFIFVGFSDILFKLIAYSTLPLIIYYSLMQSIQQNLILYLLGKENKWVYNSDNDPIRYEKFKNIYPNYFDVGHSQEIEDQFWGSINIANPVRFWSCAFTFVTGSGKSSTTHNHTIVILQLFKPVPIKFDLKRKSMLSLSGNIKTESEEFNKLYEIKCKTNESDNKLLLLKVLSPSVQVRLIQIANDLPISQIGFYDNCMILNFNKNLWKLRFTNFFKRVQVDDRDKEFINNLFKEITTTPLEMLHYID